MGDFFGFFSGMPDFESGLFLSFRAVVHMVVEFFDSKIFSSDSEKF